MRSRLQCLRDGKPERRSNRGGSEAHRQHLHGIRRPDQSEDTHQPALIGTGSCAIQRIVHRN